MNQLSKKSIIAIALLFIAGGVVFFIFFYSDNELPEATLFEFAASAYSAGSTDVEVNQRFTHPIYGFSVEYPISFITTAYKEQDGYETIVFQSEEDGKNGFQIFISPFEEGEIITHERILEDVPLAVIEEPQEVILGDNIRALIFWSEDSRVGRTREVWFTHGGNLYEITTYANLDTWLATILQTWKFEN